MKTEAKAPVKTRNPHHELGRRGEDLAVAYLTGQGLVLLDRNWRCRDGELDLVLTDGSTVVVCEVKTRAGTGFGLPAEAVDDRKARRVRRLANTWLSTFRVPWCELRFDIVAITWPPTEKPRIHHLRDAF
nr:YraN family protein [Kibdelosporangium sp. MJ126-NF4]CEL15507.1 Endonuclease [Kibdelosporangium sp. MJ126-NF4]CTQ92091.1 Endonuclease (EC 3.1.-.-) [Kibdelosporangium sp. MJ126-NF4]